jgi:hypothetical protein
MKAALGPRAAWYLRGRGLHECAGIAFQMSDGGGRAAA